MEPVSRSWSLGVLPFVAVAASSGGCFYVDAVNQRPSISIRQSSGELAYRGSNVRLEAESNDPEGHIVFYRWRAYLCTDELVCDAVPFHTEVLDATTFVVPSMRADEPVPVQAIKVILEAQDDYGAIARPHQELLIPVADHAPILDLSMRTRYGYVVDTSIDLFARVGDKDDGAENALPLDWKVFSPMNQPSYELVDIANVPSPDAPSYLQFGKRFTPAGVGEWEVQVTATDPLGVATQKSLVINVVPDHVPCLAQWAPIAAPSTSAWPMTEPTLFQVSVVQDDLDPYPTVPGDSELGTTTFAWSIKQPGASTRTSLGVTGNAASLDPASYAPGDIIELRVEITDRNDVSPQTQCSDDPTCSVISDAQCIQRLTWRVEVH